MQFKQEETMNRKLAAVLAAISIGFGLVLSASAGDTQQKAAKAAAATTPMSILDTASAAGFTTLVAAVKAAGLEETLSGKGPFTVFAPTDEAFKKLPEGALDGLLADEEALKNVLLYHVVMGNVKAADVVKLKSAKTAEGADVVIDAKNGVKINDAKVVKADVVASNGVIHVIDTVLLPPVKKK
jgi:uncharacterized surface protein with fasciclin (FAS1) repeats